MRLADAKGATAKVLSIATSDRLGGSFAVHLEEAESSRSSGVPVHDDGHGVDLAEGREEVAQLVFGRTPGEVPYVEFRQVSHLEFAVS